MILNKYSLFHKIIDFNWKNNTQSSIRIKKFFLKLSVSPVRGSLILFSLNFFQNNEIFFQNFMKNKNFFNIGYFFQKWLVFKKNKVFF